MPRKRKFRPIITKIRLNPEQAVLTCDCYDSGESFRAQTAMSNIKDSYPGCSGKSLEDRRVCLVPVDNHWGYEWEPHSASS